MALKTWREIKLQFAKILAVVMFAGFVAACSNPASAETHIVEMRGLEFFPSSLDVAVGDTIVWINMDIIPHTATAGDGSWDSGMLEEGDEFLLEIEGDTNTGGYVCSFHPTMIGQINMN
jgi:plastocyanin